MALPACDDNIAIFVHIHRGVDLQDIAFLTKKYLFIFGFPALLGTFE